MMVKLPDGVDVWVKNRKFTGEIPQEFCPKKFLHAKPELKEVKKEKEKDKK